MPKSRKSKRRNSAAGASNQGSVTQPAPAKNSFKSVFYAVVLGVAVIGGVSIWQIQTCEAAFLNVVAAQKGPLEGIQTRPNLGRGHLNPGQSYRYPDRFPTSGPHAPVWTEPGVYNYSPPAIQLVHALEHGNIVIYHDQLADDDLGTLKVWANLYGGRWSGLVVARRPGMGQEVVLTAWRKIMRMKTFDAGAAAVFVDKYRGRGPEHPVR